MNYYKDIPYKVTESVIQGIDKNVSVYNAVVEVSNGENIKYEVHPSGAYLTVVRALNPVFTFPFSYGFIPQTLTEDGLGLDVIILTEVPLEHLSVVEVRLLGYIPTIDNGKRDDKLVAIPAYMPFTRRVAMDQIMAFVKTYKYPNTQNSVVKDFIQKPEEAEKLVLSANSLFVLKSGMAAEKKDNDNSPAEVSSVPCGSNMRSTDHEIQVAEKPEVKVEVSTPFLEEAVSQEDKEVDTIWLT